MIHESLQQAGKLFSEESRLGKALSWLRSTDLPMLSTGRHEIEGENIFAMVSRYRTKTEAETQFEAHRRFTDIQVILEGRVIMGWSPVDDLDVVIPYDVQKDIAFYRKPDRFSRLLVDEGQVVIFRPADAHLPGLYVDDAAEVVKVVVKVEE